jgi:[pyruvate, water dikinase]-phosphate phosphotransferase / [pyruvate, water dikinase] kinase
VNKGEIMNLVLYVISDSIGETGEQVTRAVVSQYDIESYEIKKFPHVLEVETLKGIIEEAREERSIIIYTLVEKHLSHFVEEFCHDYEIPCIDLLNPLLNAIAYRTNLKPLREPGIIRKLDNHYFKRVEAMEFAVNNDDGKDPRGILKADLVLIGVSRTSKTPLSLYLANKNIKVCNIPLVPEVNVPKELYLVPVDKIIGLTNTPEKLNAIREERLQTLGLSTGASYANLERIEKEVLHAETVMKELGCKTIDVSNMAIEDTASIILSYLKNN